uniref:Uncharacterized protein n=1 Tax=Nelumbo nucifera TaxID=4432 RepID=A0A822YEM2_NELNU|nr:TPA_asm: hypothetical protein HUJ06_031409 [Nelumbo nucifera]
MGVGSLKLSVLADALLRKEFLGYTSLLIDLVTEIYHRLSCCRNNWF